MHAKDITQAGLYRYRRDSHLPWGWALVSESFDGCMQFQDIDRKGLSFPDDCNDERAIGEFSGPLSPDPEKDALLRLKKWCVDSLPGKILDGGKCGAHVSIIWDGCRTRSRDEMALRLIISEHLKAALSPEGGQG